MKLLLFHNSDYFHFSLKPRFEARPLFYWYSDRHHSHLGFYKYIYIFLIDPLADKVEVRSRTDTQDFDGLHKYYLQYRNIVDNNRKAKTYAEPGIVMSFNELTPALILMAPDIDEANETGRLRVKVIPGPHNPTQIDHDFYLHNKNKEPLPFAEIPEIVQAIPEISSVLPIETIEPDTGGSYSCKSWKPMDRSAGVWL